MKILSTLILALITYATNATSSAPWIGQTLNGLPCNGGGQGYGPFDWTKLENKKNWPVVEHSHFTPEVENHIKGVGGYIPNDLDYAIRAFPNHHQVLLSIIRYQFKLDQKLLTENRGLVSPVECYLQRAIHFSPKDSASHALYGYYLHKKNHLEEAAKVYAAALSIDNDNPKIAYSYALLLIDMKQFEKAAQIGKIAYQDKNTPKKLMQKLKELGVWSD